MYTYLNFTLSFFYIYSDHYSDYSKYKHNAIPLSSMSVCTTEQASSHLFVCLHVSGGLPHTRFHEVYLEFFHKICQYIQNMVKIGQKHQTLCDNLYMFMISHQDWPSYLRQTVWRYALRQANHLSPEDHF
jgi:hypothetical protein